MAAGSKARLSGILGAQALGKSFLMKSMKGQWRFMKDSTTTAMIDDEPRRCARGLTREFSELSHRVIGCAIEVHRVLGPGLLESAYRRCLAHELELHGMRVVVEQALPLTYKSLRVEGAYRIDLMVEGQSYSRSRASPRSRTLTSTSCSRI